MGKSLLLTPGFRFHPTDVELVKYYLKRKVLGRKFHFEAISELDIYKHAPWDLPDKSCLKSKDLKWYFFCPREKKYACGARMNRATEFGYWKTTGKDRPVIYNGDVVGMIKTLVFHRGRAPQGDRTDWVMHEYRLQEKDLTDKGVPQDSYVLCMIFQKEGPGPRNGAQYGAPFKEEEWTDDDGENCIEVGSLAKTSVTNSVVLDRDYAAGSSHIPTSNCLELPSESCVSGPVIPNVQVIKPVASGPHALKSAKGFGSLLQCCVSDMTAPCCKLTQTFSDNVGMDNLLVSSDDDILSLLDCFVEGDAFMVNENKKTKDINNVNQDHAVTGAACYDGIDIFKGLDDLGNLGGSNAHTATCTFDEIFSSDDGNSFLELMDLAAPLTVPTGVTQEDFHLNRPSASFNNYPNLGESNCQVNAVQTSMWPDSTHGVDEHRFESYTATQKLCPPNRSCSLAP